MNTSMCDDIKAGDVLEILRGDDLISVLVLLVTDEAVILDACDDTTPFVIARDELVIHGIFNSADL